VNVTDLANDPGARRARKLPVALAVEFAPADGTLQTTEGPVRYRADDALVTGTDGERWPVPRAGFDATYEPLPPLRPGKSGRYRKRPLVVWAKPMREAFEVTLDRGRGTLRGDAADWLVQYAPGDLAVVSASAFAQTYELLD
jgi:hypothetical protein